MKYKAESLLCLILISAVILCVNGCGKDSAQPNKNKILAKINKYELTTEDFIDELRRTATDKDLSGDQAIIKEELLEELIMKKILLEEAQRENFDKDRAFMKEIERYWEQALLKLLIRKKMADLSSHIVIKESEVRSEYEKMPKGADGKAPSFESKASEIRDDIYNRRVQEAFDKWLGKLRSEADVKIYKENL